MVFVEKKEDISELIQRKSFNTNLEALRGFVAIFVVVNHLQALHGQFNSKYLPKLLIEFSPNGHLCVLVFFILSGYVIYISNQQGLVKGQLGAYIRKRFIRIYPIYFIAMIFTLIIATQYYSLYSVLCNFALLQDLLVPPFVENGPAWSLHFEALYYLFFIPVSYYKLNPIVVFVFSLIIALANYYTYPNPNTAIISSYLFGFAFWMAGLCIARYAHDQKEKTPYRELLSVLFLFLAIDRLVAKSGLPYLCDYASVYFFHMHLLYPAIENSKILIGYKDLAFLPYCIYLVLIFSGKKFKYQNQFFIILQVPLVFALSIIFTDFFIKGNHQHILTFLIAVTYYLISWVLLIFDLKFIGQIGKKTMALGVWLGGISYALYIIHMPVIYLFGRIGFLNGTAYIYTIKLILFEATVIGLSYLLERKFQPWIKKFLAI